MLINLSNHPFEKWSDRQKDAALQKYGSVKDVAFPLIPPEANSSEVDLIAQEYEEAILPLNLSAVHIMGELTFTYQMVVRLKALHIECIASTTQRNVEMREDGTSISKFEFVKFRKY